MSLRELSWDIDIKGARNGINDVRLLDDAVTGLSNNMRKASGGVDFKAMGTAVTGLGKTLTKRLTLPIVGAGAMATKTVSGFDDSMSRVKAIGGFAADEYDKLRAKAQKLGSTTAHTASQAAEGMGILAATGMQANEILATSENMLNLMSAGAISAETSAGILTNTMAQFNMTADQSGRIADIFASGAANAKVSVEQLEYAMSVAGGAMATTNMTAEQSVAAVGQLANAGTPINQVGTTLNAMAREMKANADKFKDLGIDVYDPVTKSIKDMGAVMAELEVATSHMTDEQRDAALATIFSGQSIRGVIGWLGQGSDAYDALTGSIEGSDGAAAKMAAEMEDNIGGAFRGLKSAIEGLGIEIGDVLKDDIKAITGVVADAARSFSNLDDDTKRMIVTIGGFAAAAGPVLMIGGKLMRGIAGIPSKVATAKAAFGVMAGAINPVTIGMGVAIAAGVALYKNWDTVKEVAGTVTGFISDRWNAVAGVFDSVRNKVISAGNAVIDKWNGMKAALAKPIQGVVNIAQKGTNWVKGKFGADGSHATGLNYVPKDNYMANLHQGEMVLTKQASEQYRALGGTKDVIPQIATNTIVKKEVVNPFKDFRANNKEDIKNPFEDLKTKFLPNTNNTSNVENNTAKKTVTFSPTVVVNVQDSPDKGQDIASKVRREIELLFREWQLQEV